jgi:hypothetical protein
MLRIHHRKTSGLPDDPTYDVGSGEWNDSIVVKDDGGGSADGAVFVRKAADVDGWIGVPSAAGVLACSTAGALPTFRALTTADLPAGSRMLSGAGEPTAAVGAVGDLYLNTTTGKWSGPKTADATVPWPPMPRTYLERILRDGVSNYWRLNETTGTTAVDRIGGANGTIAGGVTLSQPGALSDGDKAMTFNGTTGWIVTSGNVTVPAICTLEMWAKSATSIPLQARLLDNGGGSGGTFTLAVNVGRLAFVSSNFSTSVRHVDDGQWHHLVCVLSGGTVSFYIDGTFDVSRTETRAVSNTTPLGIASAPAFGELFPGSLDEIAIYPRALSAAEIAAHYAARLWT